MRCTYFPLGVEGCLSEVTIEATGYKYKEVQVASDSSRKND